MKKSFMVFEAITVFALSVSLATGQGRLGVQDREVIRRTLEFSGDGTKLLEVDGVSGSIRVTGYDGRSVEMSANKTIRADSQAKIQTAKEEVKLDITDKTNTIAIYVDQPGHDHSTSSSSRSHSFDRGYDVNFDFEIRVPRGAEIHLRTVNGGDIHVQNVDGDFDVSNINGSVEMLDVSGSGRAHTINGQVHIKFAGNPRRDSSFSSLNGMIEVAFKPNLSANLRFKTFNGGVYTDFPVTRLASAPGTEERRDGKFVYRSNGFSDARVANGGPELTFDAFNGNIQILQEK